MHKTPSLLAVSRQFMSLCFTALMLFSATVFAQADYSAVQAKLSEALSANGNDTPIASVKPAEAAGLLEVVLEGGLVLYATENGDFFIAGDLYQISDEGLINLAERKREGARKAILDAVPVEDMIVFTPEGEVRGYINVFTDVTCFYCQKLHREVDQLNAKGIEVRYLAYPRAGMESDGAKKLATAWCADNPQETLTQLKSGVALPINECEDAPIADQYQLGQALGIRGTPAIVTSEGVMVPGYKPANALAAMLGLN